jgi:hypothetical protein
LEGTAQLTETDASVAFERCRLRGSASQQVAHCRLMQPPPWAVRVPRAFSAEAMARGPVIPASLQRFSGFVFAEVRPIWRGLAGMHGSLRLAWNAATPIHESGEPERALARSM